MWRAVLTVFAASTFCATWKGKKRRLTIVDRVRTKHAHTKNSNFEAMLET
jgi:hypothetical protein